MLSVDLGRHGPAIQQLTALLGQPATSYERAIRWRLRARLAWQQGDAPAMLQAADRSLALALADGDARGAQLATAERLLALAVPGPAPAAVQQAQQLLATMVAEGQ